MGFIITKKLIVCIEFFFCLCSIMTYGEAADQALEAGTRLCVVSLDAKPPVVKFESVAKAPPKPKTMKQQKAAIKEKRKKDLEQRRANTFKEVRPYSFLCPVPLIDSWLSSQWAWEIAYHTWVSIRTFRDIAFIYLNASPYQILHSS